LAEIIWLKVAVCYHYRTPLGQIQGGPKT